jgi:hypothetical protein
MPRQLLSAVIVAAWLTALAVGLWSQTPSVSARDALVEMLVWGADLPVDLKAFPPEVRAELERHLQRYKAYRSKRPKPARPGLDEMLYSTLIRYEGKLAAVSGDPRAPALAAAYVESLLPCYEWEGFHDCPEREAKFAAEYQKAHPGGPFSDYLPLLEAHRWLCTVEAYDYEKQPEDAARSRRAYEQTISIARQSKSLLVRLAADRLTERNHCLSQH